MKKPMPTPAAKKPTIVVIHSERIIGSDGSITYKPLHIADAGIEVTTTEAAKITGLKIRWIQQLCDEGFYKTARRKGPGGRSGRSEWLIARWEVLKAKLSPPD